MRSVAAVFLSSADFRTVEQDAGFGIRQIVDIALKALSPGVNDTSTAVSCLDYLSAILSRLARQRFETRFRQEDGKLRVIAQVPSFAEFVAKSFDEIRLSANGNVTIILQMLRVLGRVGSATKGSARKQPLLEQARVLINAANRSVEAAYDRARINQELETIRAHFNGSESDLPSPLSSYETNEEISASGLR